MSHSTSSAHPSRAAIAAILFSVLLLASPVAGVALADQPQTVTFNVDSTPANMPGVPFTFTVTSGSCTVPTPTTTWTQITCDKGSTYVVSDWPNEVVSGDSHWFFDHITGAVGAITSNNPTITLHYNGPEYLVAFAVSPAGAGTTDPSGSGYYSGTLPISASPNAGYAFSAWTSSTPSISFDDSSSSSTTATISGPGTITANFVAAPAADDPPVSTASVTSGTMGLNGWYVSPTVTVTITATDGDSGVASITYSLDGGASVTAPGASVDVLVTGDGSHSLSFFATDNGGIVESPANTFGLKIDSTPPAIVITTPASTYILNQPVFADYGCTDATSGVASCTGTVPSGSAIDTSTVGTHTFTVNSGDNAGNTAQSTETYTVVYGTTSGFFLQPVLAPVQTFNSGSTIPVKFQLTDFYGNYVSTAVAHISIVGPNGAVTPTSKVNTGDLFRYDPTGQIYIYNLSTGKTWTPGAYVITATLDDGTSHSVTVWIK